MTTAPVDSVSPLSVIGRARLELTRPDRRALYALVGADLIVGLVLRVVVYRSSIGRLEGDEALWGLMARRATHGQISAFLWSQPYGGTQEVLLVAVLFLLFGTHLLLMRLVPIVLTVATAFVVWRIGKRTIGELPAIVAALLLWVWPPYLLWKLQIWHGFYGSGLLYTAIILLLTLRIAESPSKRDVAVLGLVLGLAFWQTLQIAAIVVPSLLWLTARRPGVWRSAWVAVPGVVVGGLPWLLSNLHHHWWSFTFLPSSGTYVTKLHGYVTDTFPMMLGLRVPFAVDWLLTKIGMFSLYLALIALFAVCAWRWRRTPLSLFVTVIAAYPFLYSLSGLTWLTTEPRYVVLVMPPVVLIVAKFATTLARAAAILGVGAVCSVVVLARWIDWSHDTAPEAAYDVHYVDVAPAIQALERAGISRAYAEYWLAYRITFMTRERIIVSEGDMNDLRAVSPHRVLPPLPTDFRMHHHPAYDTAVRTAPRHAYLLVLGDLGERRDLKLLLSHGYTEEKLGPVLMLVSPSQRAG